jgi:hypothetical protein
LADAYEDASESLEMIKHRCLAGVIRRRRTFGSPTPYWRRAGRSLTSFFAARFPDWIDAAEWLSPTLQPAVAVDLPCPPGRFYAIRNHPDDPWARLPYLSPGMLRLVPGTLVAVLTLGVGPSPELTILAHPEDVLRHYQEKAAYELMHRRGHPSWAR